MSKLRATVELTYPTPATLKIVTAAGGVSRLTPAQLERVVFKTVLAGGSCDDLPAISRDALIAGGQVEQVGTKKGAKS